jgi:hypothetical protein
MLDGRAGHFTVGVAGSPVFGGQQLHSGNACPDARQMLLAV